MWLKSISNCHESLTTSQPVDARHSNNNGKKNWNWLLWRLADWRTGGLAQQYLQRSWWHTEDKDTEIERKTIENKTRPQTEQQRHWQVASILSILMKTFSIDNSNEVSSISFFRYYLHSISINFKFQITINTNFLYLNHSIGNQRIYRNLLLLFRVSIKPNNIFVKI